MNSIYSHKRTTCRLCESNNLDLVVSLEPTPPAEWYLKDVRESLSLPKYPLDLYLCKDCGHAQLLDVLNSTSLFANYFYETETSPGLISHFEAYAKILHQTLCLEEGELVVDIGSNDGTLLNNLKDLGLQICGVEPSRYLSEGANSRGILTINEFLNDSSVSQILSQLGKARVVTANNVFAHNDRLDLMLESVYQILEDQGYFVFEVSSLLHTLDGMVFDYIYHEHLSYHSLLSLIPFLKEQGFGVRNVEYVPTKGGSYRVWSQKGFPQIELENEALKFLSLELNAKINSKDTFNAFVKEIDIAKEQTLKLLGHFNKEKPVVVAYGASATVTTLAYHFKLLPYLAYLVDDNSIRHGSYLPGTSIPVHKPDYLKQEVPDAIIILAWRFKDMIIDKLKKLIPADTKIITPLPFPEMRELGDY